MAKLKKKEARIKCKTFCSKKEKGWLKLPNLRNYYWAAQLRDLIMWITKEKNAVCVEMEQNAFKNVSLESPPFLNERTRRRQLQDIETVEFCSQGD